MPEQLLANGTREPRNSHVTHVSEVQESMNNKKLEDPKWSGMDWYAWFLTDDGLSVDEVWGLDVPFNDDALQNLTGNVNLLRYL